MHRPAQAARLGMPKPYQRIRVRHIKFFLSPPFAIESLKALRISPILTAL